METKVVIGKVRLSYVNVFEARSIGDDERAKYSVSIIVDKEDKKSIAKIEAAVEAAKQEGKGLWGGKIPKNIKLPLRDGDTDREDDEAYAGKLFFNASSNYKPEVIDRYKQPISDPDELYSGCYAYVSINFYPYDYNGSKGVAAGLNNIMKVAEGERLSGRLSAEADFADIEIDEDDSIFN
jgi:hypothetical protein